MDPTTNLVRYVGKANQPAKRMREHRYSGREVRSHKKNWINKLKKDGHEPQLLILDEVQFSEWRFWESYWIDQCTAWGFDLVNHTGGGDGSGKGNQTSFKKGRVPKHAGTARTKVCWVCTEEYVPRGAFEKSKFCSKKCYAEYRKKNTPDSCFKKKRIPWNKGLKYQHKNK